MKITYSEITNFILSISLYILGALITDFIAYKCFHDFYEAYSNYSGVKGLILTMWVYLPSYLFMDRVVLRRYRRKKEDV